MESDRVELNRLMYRIEKLAAVVESLAGGQGPIRERFRGQVLFELEIIQRQPGATLEAELRLQAIADHLVPVDLDAIPEHELVSAAFELARIYGALSAEYGRATAD